MATGAACWRDFIRRSSTVRNKVIHSKKSSFWNNLSFRPSRRRTLLLLLAGPSSTGRGVRWSCVLGRSRSVGRVGRSVGRSGRVRRSVGRSGAVRRGAVGHWIARWFPSTRRRGCSVFNELTGSAVSVLSRRSAHQEHHHHKSRLPK